MTIEPLPGALHPTLVDCPLCAGPAALDDPADVLDCPACGIRFEIAPDEPALPAAA